MCAKNARSLTIKYQMLLKIERGAYERFRKIHARTHARTHISTGNMRGALALYGMYYSSTRASIRRGTKIRECLRDAAQRFYNGRDVQIVNILDRGLVRKKIKEKKSIYC